MYFADGLLPGRRRHGLFKSRCLFVLEIEGRMWNDFHAVVIGSARDSDFIISEIMWVSGLEKVCHLK